MQSFVFLTLIFVYHLASAEIILQRIWRGHDIRVDKIDGTDSSSIRVRYTNFSKDFYSDPFYPDIENVPRFPDDIFDLVWEVDVSGNTSSTFNFKFMNPGVAAVVNEPVMNFFKEHKAQLYNKSLPGIAPYGDSPSISSIAATGNQFYENGLRYFEFHPEPQVADKIVGDTLILVHSDSRYDTKQAAAVRVRELQRQFIEKNKNVVHLYEYFPTLGWYGDSTYPTHVFLSTGGAHSLKLTGGKITLVGGFWGACFRRGVIDTIANHFIISKEALEIDFPMAGIFEGTPANNLSRQSVERLANDFEAFLYNRDNLHIFNGDPSQIEIQFLKYNVPFKTVGTGRPQVLKVNFID